MLGSPATGPTRGQHVSADNSDLGLFSNPAISGAQVLTIKPRFVVDNQTGMAMEVKQRGTPDLSADPFYGDKRRCSCRLDTGQRYAPCQRWPLPT